MTLKELNIFYKICQNPNLTSLAKEINISQSAVSIAIKSLEKKLNEPLFNRVGKRLILNERGRKFYELSYTSYKKLLEAKDIFLSSSLSGELRVSASKTVANFIMPKIYFDFLSKHENVSLHVNTLNSLQILKQVQLGEIDIGLIETEVKSPSVKKEYFKKDELILVTSDKSQKTEVFIDEIDKKWILRESGSGTKEEFIKALEDEGKNIKTFLTLNDFQEIKQVLLKNQNTISAISKIAVKDELKSKKLYEIKLKNINLTRNFYIIYHKNHYKNRLFCEFINFIKNH